MSQKVKMIIAADHAGFALKSALIRRFTDRVEWVDLGTHSEESVHYPEYGVRAAQAVAEGVAPMGVIICGSGIGISIAANRNRAVRAALCTSVEMAILARQHNDANILALGARIVSEDVATACLDAFLKTEFEGGGRHEARVKMLGEC